MHEQVLALIVGRDEPEALLVAEPLHRSGGHRFLPGGRVLRNAGGAKATTTDARTTSPNRLPGTMDINVSPALGTLSSSRCVRARDRAAAPVPRASLEIASAG